MNPRVRIEVELPNGFTLELSQEQRVTYSTDYRKTALGLLRGLVIQVERALTEPKENP